MSIWLIILLVGLGAHLVRAGPLLAPKLADRVPFQLLTSLPLIALSCLAATAFVGATPIDAIRAAASIALAIAIGIKASLGLAVLAGWAAYALAGLVL